MSAIQREIEKAGVATISLSLVKEFTQKVRPPRALWVPFAFGRPLGTPGNVKVQRKVLTRAFTLLQRESGPVLEEFQLDPEDEHLDAQYQTMGKRCGPQGCSLDDILADDAADVFVETPFDGNLAGVLQEIDTLQSAHQRYGGQRKGRTSIGASGTPPERIAESARTIR